MFNFSQNGTPIDWNAVINQGFALGSHAIAAYSGANSGTQIGYNAGQGGVFAIQQTQPVGGLQPYGLANVPTYNGQNPSGGVGAGIGSGVGSGIDTALNWAAQNPVLVAGGALGLYLLFKEPPRRR